MFETKEGPIKPIVYIGIINKDRLLLVDYRKPPNPEKPGWWIPAPGLEYGANPQEKVRQICADFGLTVKSLKFKENESFVSPGGWHLIWHYIVKTDGEPQPNSGVKSYRWVTLKELSEIGNMAHGQWEISIGKSYLEMD
jgi:hypothetical protein